MAFNYCKNLTSITISGRITKIDYRTFGSCEKLKTIIIPDGVTSIDSHAFNDCYRLASITIPSSVTSIGNHVFYNVVEYFHIIFIGTISQWKGIALGNNWTGATSRIIDYTIHCTDGEIAKDGTITYH